MQRVLQKKNDIEACLRNELRKTKRTKQSKAKAKRNTQEIDKKKPSCLSLYRTHFVGIVFLFVIPPPECHSNYSAGEGYLP